MPIGILRSTYSFDSPITYTPIAGATPRNLTITRSQTTIGAKIKPLVLCDTGFFSADSYAGIIDAMSSTGMRNWDDPQTPKQPAKATITKRQWTDFRGREYANTEMIGSMLVKIVYRSGDFEPVDFIVSAAPNMLFGKGKYADHTAGDNKAGGQIHSEIFMCAQLSALLSAMKAARETPVHTQTRRAGLSAGPVEIDAQMYIEKGSLCDGCRGTWNQLVTRVATDNITVAFQC